MGNRLHLNWLLEGVDAWNARRAHEDFVPDFEGMDIRKAFKDAGKLVELGRIPLEEANLRGAYLREANLRGANLRGAYLREADLWKADLRMADLWKADLDGANLRMADLWKADLGEADLGRANLKWADLEGANIRTVYSGVSTNDFGTPEYTNLSTTKSLTQEQLDTMNGDTGVILPKGLVHPAHWPDPQPPKPEEEPESDPKRPFVFLSYAAKDRDVIQSLHGFLTSQGLPLWWDQDIPPGDGWRDRVQDQLGSAAVIVTFWTAASVGSDAVREEASTAQSAGKLIHVRLDDTPLPFGYAETQYQDLRDWDGTDSDPRFQRLVQALKDKLDPNSVNEVRYTSPAEFRTIGAKLDVNYTPTRPAAREASRTPIDEDQTARTRSALLQLTLSYCKALRRYKREAQEQSNRVSTAEQLLGIAEDLRDALKAEEFLPTLLQDYAEALALSDSDALEALEGPDIALHQSLVKRARQHYAAYPELAEISDPTNTRFITDEYPYSLERFKTELQDVAYSPEGLQIFTEETRVLIEAEERAKVPQGLDEEKTKLARLGAIAGEMRREMSKLAGKGKDLVDRSAAWLKTWEKLQKIWDAIEPYIGKTPDG